MGNAIIKVLQGSVLMCNDRTARSFSTPLFAENTDLLHVYYVTGHLGT